MLSRLDCRVGLKFSDCPCTGHCLAARFVSAVPAVGGQQVCRAAQLQGVAWWAARRWRFPITCRGRPEFTEWMMKPLQGGVGDFPNFLRPINERPIDVAFYGCVQEGCLTTPLAPHPVMSS